MLAQWGQTGHVRRGEAQGESGRLQLGLELVRTEKHGGGVAVATASLCLDEAQ